MKTRSTINVCPIFEWRLGSMVEKCIECFPYSYRPCVEGVWRECVECVKCVELLS